MAQAAITSGAWQEEAGRAATPAEQSAATETDDAAADKPPK